MAVVNTETTEKQEEKHAHAFVDAAVRENRGRGRPPKPPAVETAEQPADDELPLIDRLKIFTENQWQTTLFLYLYRLYPITDRKATGNDNYQRKYTKPIDIEDIMLEFGSGVYRLQLNDYNSATGRTNILGKQVIRILNENHPPKIPLGEWIDDERNKDWWWAKPKLMEKQNAQLKANGGGDAALVTAIADAIRQAKPTADAGEQKQLMEIVLSSMQANMNQMVDMARKSSGELLPIVQTIIAMTSKQNSGVDLAGIAALLNAVKPASDGPMMTMVMGLLESERAKSDKFLEKLMERMDRRGGGGGAAKSDAVDWSQIVRDVAPGLFQTLNTWGSALAYKWGSEQQQKRQSTIVSASPQITEGGNVPSEQEKIQMLQQINAQFGPQFDLCIPKMMEIFDDDGYGMEFRNWFVEENGKLAYRSIRQMDVQTILALIDMRRQTGPDDVKRRLQSFNPLEKATQFVQEFFSEEPLPQEDEDVPPPGVQVGNSSGGF